VAPRIATDPPLNPDYRLSGCTASDKGDRDYQQDRVVLLSHPGFSGCVLAVLADGMGGRSGGRKASDQVILTARQLFDRYAADHDDADELLAQIARQSHIVIRLTAISSEQEPHSTVAAFLLNPTGDCHWMHVGDSRIYHYRDGRLVRRTSDHSYVQQLVDRGALPKEQASRHAQSHILMACLGSETEPPIATHSIAAVRPGDCMLACSDGVWHYFEELEMGAVLSNLTAREATEFLMATARKRARGGGDNLSLVVLKIEALP